VNLVFDTFNTNDFNIFGRLRDWSFDFGSVSRSNIALELLFRFRREDTLIVKLLAVKDMQRVELSVYLIVNVSCVDF
jgi:hypothetical protein